ncbi:uncharacterized protein BO72DRAFT_463958 [Aspergillus fijiensis CBS 313.89]|uniref:Rhodopsin domain-containing protein n=1 Tax=Aspergillus fijiensis CBS 313.89 TaxID=1448319 RepID=A0A8G1VTQ0_9EURO|nr:uncharacterized protein BO72DRAFT_463958 [Aspergillus fijiensis CBS 313.89]RAK71283.1 hypothetical protein BO72DRAFT_463958 [Aspergillus fijiensis CBS 313.89]
MNVAQRSALPEDISKTRHAAIFGVGIGFIVFDSIVVALRIYARAFMLRALGADDILMIIGAILNFGLSITIMTGSRYGIGKHALAITESDTVPMLKCIWVTRLFYTLSMGLVKMFLLWFYLRLDPRRFMRWAVFFVMFLNIGLSLASFIGSLASCRPPSLFWTSPTGDSRCMSLGAQQLFYEVNGVLNIVTDILIYLLPVPMLYGLQVTWRKKGAILAIFGLGILSIAAACVRYNFVRRLASAKEEYYLLLADSLNWCTIEAYVAIFCGCAPSLSVLIKAYAPSIFGSSTARISHSAQFPGASDLQQRSALKANRRRGVAGTTLGSQDVIVTGSAPDQLDQDGIVMKTIIQTYVTTRESTEEESHRREYYNLARRT